MTKSVAMNAAILVMGAGKMGLAILEGWSRAGLAGPHIQILDPNPSAAALDYCSRTGAALNPASVRACDVLLLAIKPQALDGARAQLAGLAGPQTLLISILAGKSIADLFARAPEVGAIVRAMPNSPAAVGRGVSGAYACPATSPEQRQLAESLLEATGAAVWLESEDQMDALTAVSGSGPAYVFLMTECLANAGRQAGLPKVLAQKLARATVEGAGELLYRTPDLSPEQLRINVTSPGGTTEAALEVLNKDQVLCELMTKAVAAATARGRALTG